MVNPSSLHTLDESDGTSSIEQEDGALEEVFNAIAQIRLAKIVRVQELEKVYAYHKRFDSHYHIHQKVIVKLMKMVLFGVRGPDWIKNKNRFASDMRKK